MARLTLEQYRAIKEEIVQLDKDMLALLAQEKLDGVDALRYTARCEEIKRELRQQRPVLRRKQAKCGSEITKLVFDPIQECWMGQ